jgi:hypothetical protein
MALRKNLIFIITLLLVTMSFSDLLPNHEDTSWCRNNTPKINVTKFDFKIETGDPSVSSELIQNFPMIIIAELIFDAPPPQDWYPEIIIESASFRLSGNNFSDIYPSPINLASKLTDKNRFIKSRELIVPSDAFEVQARSILVWYSDQYNKTCYIENWSYGATGYLFEREANRNVFSLNDYINKKNLENTQNNNMSWFYGAVVGGLIALLGSVFVLLLSTNYQRKMQYFEDIYAPLLHSVNEKLKHLKLLEFYAHGSSFWTINADKNTWNDILIATNPKLYSKIESIELKLMEFNEKMGDEGEYNYVIQSAVSKMGIGNYFENIYPIIFRTVNSEYREELHKLDKLIEQNEKIAKIYKEYVELVHQLTELKLELESIIKKPDQKIPI